MWKFLKTEETVLYILKSKTLNLILQSHVNAEAYSRYLQEADVVLHVGQLAQLGALPTQLRHLLLQPLDLTLNLAAQGGLVGAEELTNLGAGQIDGLGEL